MVGRFSDIHIHLAGSCARPAGYAFARIHAHLEKRHFIEQRIKRAQRTEPLAEGAIHKHTAQNNRQQHTAFPCKQLAQRGADARVRQGQRNRALQHTLRAEILAEERIAHAELIGHQHRKQDHHHQQHPVFQIPQRLELLGRYLGRRDFVQQLLKPPEGAEEAADESAQ